jgi:hypothetical protein
MMRTAIRVLSALLGAAALAGTAAARAGDLILDCKVHANQPDHGKTDWRRRLILSTNHMVEISDDFGDGLKPRTRYHVLSTERRRITLENGGGKLAYLDPHTRTYHLSDAPRHFTLEGPCERVRGEQ